MNIDRILFFGLLLFVFLWLFSNPDLQTTPLPKIDGSELFEFQGDDLK
jgi:hypothetical protein